MLAYSTPWELPRNANYAFRFKPAESETLGPRNRVVTSSPGGVSGERLSVITTERG